MRAPDPLALVIEGHPALVCGRRPPRRWCPGRSSRVSVSAAARCGATTASVASAAACTSPSPVSTAAHCVSDNRRASPAAVVAHSPGTGARLLPGARRRAGGPARPGSPPRPAARRPSRPATARRCGRGALLDRPDRRVEPADHVQPLDQLAHREHARYRRQRRVRRADPHPLPPTPTTPYAAHPIGVLRPRRCCPQQPHLRRSADTYRHLTRRNPDANRGFEFL